MNKQTMAIVGSVLLFVGVFTPILSMPIVGNLNYFQNGKGDGVIILIFAAVGLYFAVKEQFKFVLYAGIFSLGLLASTMVRIMMRLHDMKSEMETSLAGNPFRGFVDMAYQSIQLQWGWAILFVGGGLMVASALMKDSSSNRL